MSEILPPECTTQLRTKRVSDLQRRRSKLAFLLRCFVLLSVLTVYSIRYTINARSPAVEPPQPLRSVGYGRTILGLRVLDYTTSESLATDDDSGRNCTAPAITEFPPDGFTAEQRRQGWIVLHILTALYCFWSLAVICDDYFVPAIEQICLTIQMQKDVVGATFMAAATSSPELFMNCVGTFVTKGDIGVGTIVGSAVFNILAVPACCGLFARQCVRIDWWPLTRDCLLYCVAVLGLIATLYDGRIMWYEALVLVLAYFFYMAVMYYNDKMAMTARRLISKYRRRSQARPYRAVTEFTTLLTKNNNSALPAAAHSTLAHVEKCASYLNNTDTDTDTDDFADSPWQRNKLGLYEFLLRWPITLLLWCTIPDSRKHPRWKYVALLLAIAWIGVISYLVAFAITIIGDALDIPESVMGLTILAAGMSVPEAVSSIIVTKQGQGAMGISNSIGSNTFDILLCLGVPWLIKAYFLPERPGELWVTLNSAGLTYSAVFLLTTLFGLFIAFVANKFVLDWKVGVACSAMYLGYLTVATLIELNVFFPVNLPVCKH